MGEVEQGTYPTADQVARIILASCKLWRESWEDLCRGQMGMSSRATAFATISCAFPHVQRQRIGLMLGFTGDRAANLHTTINTMERKRNHRVGKVIVNKILKAAGLKAQKEPAPDRIIPPPMLAVSAPPPPPKPASMRVEPSTIAEAVVSGAPVFVPRPVPAGAAVAKLRADLAAVEAQFPVGRRRQPLPPERTVSWTAIAMGDPPPGRSALDPQPDLSPQEPGEDAE